MATAYLVLAKDREGRYSPLGRFVGGGSQAAIRSFADQMNGEASAFVAVPVRNWTEVEAYSVQPPPRVTFKKVEAPSPLPAKAAAQAKLDDDESKGDETKEDED